MDSSKLPALAQRIRSAHARIEQGRKEWIEGTIDLAQALAEAREQFTSDNRFSDWLAENELDGLGKNDRAALIHLAGEQDLRRCLEETESASWRLIWDNIRQERYPSAGKPDEDTMPMSTLRSWPVPDDGREPVSLNTSAAQAASPVAAMAAAYQKMLEQPALPHLSALLVRYRHSRIDDEDWLVEKLRATEPDQSAVLLFSRIIDRLLEGKPRPKLVN